MERPPRSWIRTLAVVQTATVPKLICQSMSYLLTSRWLFAETEKLILKFIRVPEYAKTISTLTQLEGRHLLKVPAELQ